MNKELWKPIQGYEGIYEVSNFGRVRGQSCVMKQHIKNGYCAIRCHKNGTSKGFYVHRLVAQAFIPNPSNLPEVNHIDANKRNNRVDNLEWCDRKRNLQHSYDLGLKRRGENHGCHKLSEEDVLNIKREYVKDDREHSLNALARKYGVAECTIHAIICGRLWSHLKER